MVLTEKTAPVKSSTPLVLMVLHPWPPPPLVLTNLVNEGV